MSNERKSTDPMDRMGVYKQLSDVPNRYRLHQFATMYENRDIWEEYLTEHRLADNPNQWKIDMSRRIGRRWTEFISEQECHHALATPDDVEKWSQILLDDLAIRTALDYWAGVERFYRWLQWHTDHPHVYHPFLMAAADGGMSNRIWMEKMNCRRGGGDTNE